MTFLRFVLAGILAWSIRGQLGGWWGGLSAGLLLGGFFALNCDSKCNLTKSSCTGIILSSLGFMWGGEISYGREFHLLATSFPNPSEILATLVQLFLFGASWGGIGGLGIGYIFKEKISKREWIAFLLINLFWLATIWMGFGRLIWVAFLLILLVVWFMAQSNIALKIIRTFSIILAICTAFGFAVSGIALLFSQMVPFEFLKEALKLRDQIIGAFVGIGLLNAQRIARQSNLKNTGTMPNAISLKIRDFQTNLGYTLLACLLTIIAIAKEAVPEWPNKWEWSYNIMIFCCCTLAVDRLRKKINSDESCA